ncbi:MAG TPA: hypothetical protein VL091_08235, partial [Marinobacter sp.]|nr:hypothetical protein [Marinobacter sp.]
MRAFWLTPLLGFHVFIALIGHAFAATDSPGQSYESCGLITSEYLTILQLSDRGLSAEALTESLPDISEKAATRVKALISLANKTGLTETYSTIHSEYIACARVVYKHHGAPGPGTRESHFYHCAGENKIRYEISMAAIIGAEQIDVARQLPASYSNV